MADATTTLRHFLATLAYRFQTAVRDAPREFGDFEAGHGVRTPAHIVRHMTHLLKYSHSRFDAAADVDPPTELTFAEGVLRFHELLAVLDRDLAERPEDGDDDVLLKLLQGPLADAMTHAGQLAMLRRLAGAPVRGQSFVAADIRIGRVGADQSAPRRLFEG